MSEGEIKSRSNPKLKAARRVRDGHDRGHFFVEGKRLCSELLESTIGIQSVFASHKFAEEHPDLIERLASSASNTKVIGNSLLESLAETKSPQGVVAICKKPFTTESDLNSLLAKDTCTIAMFEQVSSPGNLGSVIRCAEAFGVDAILISPGSTDAFSPSAVRGSMGSTFRLPVFQEFGVQEMVELSDAHNIRIYGADVEADNTLDEIIWSPKRLILFGSEAHGFTDQAKSAIHETFRIDMKSIESLNLAAAAAITLYSSSIK